MKHTLLFILSLIALASCTTAQKQVQSGIAEGTKLKTEDAGTVEALSPVVVYRMNGDYADLVPVNLNEAGTGLVSYPDPLDITPSQKPEPLVDGWYLDHRGVGTNTAFTTWTYEEYHALPKAPTQAEIMAHIKVRGAVTEVRRLGSGEMSYDEIINLLKSRN